MPRTPRRDAPGAVHHVMVRGIERREIFRDDQDRSDFVRRLERLLPEENTECFAWALMPNHVHMVLRTGPGPISRLMARLGTGYAVRFNTRHDRVGHLFQNRFTSVPVTSSSHGMWLVRYVHCNPLRAGLISSIQALAKYPWSGHAELMGVIPTRLIAVDEVLPWFGSSPEIARRALTDWLKDEARELPKPPFKGPRRQAMRNSARTGVRKISALERLMRAICDELDVSPQDVLMGSRARPITDARALIVYRARTELGLKNAELEHFLGLSSGAATHAYARGRGLAWAKIELAEVD